MKEIMNLFEEISDEIDGAYHYAEEAVAKKDTDPERANVYLEMSRQELNHVDRLHDMVKKVIKKYKDGGGVMPAGMEEIYDWQHKKMIACVAKVRNIHEMYK